MSRRAEVAAAWVLFALSVTCAVAGVAVAALFERRVEWSGFGFALSMLVFPAFGMLIVSRAANVIGWLLLVVGLAGTVTIALGSLADAQPIFPGIVWIAWVANWIWPFSLGSLVLILQLFPDGRLLSRRWRWLFALTVIAVGCLVVGSALGPGKLGDYRRFSNPVGIEALRGTPISGEENIGWALLIPAILGSAASLIVRYRRSRGERRQQLKWLAYAAALFGIGWIGVTVTWDSPRLALIGEVAFSLGMLALPVAVGVAILKYRLYDIDVVINKTLVYGALAGLITAVYVAVVVGLGSVIGTRGEPNLGLQIAATALVAVAFQPARARVQRLANRLVYGERATPYEVLARFSEGVAGSYASEEALPRMARAAAEGTGARSAQIWLRLGGDLRPAAAWPNEAPAPATIPLDDGDLPPLPGADRSYPVRHRGELLGGLAVAKPPGDPVRPHEEALLRDLAAQAGLVLRNVRLTAELRARLDEITRQADELRESRRRLVAAQDGERRRLERNIHDGAQQYLVALAVRLRLAENVAGEAPATARPVLEQLLAETEGTLQSLRELARGLYPPMLERDGIAAALRSQASRSAVPVEITGEIGRYDTDVEAAAYFACLEALQNAAKYAEASRVVVRLGEDEGRLWISIADDGRGFDPATAPPGSGLRNMADRLEAVGGSISIESSLGEGTTVTGRIPVRQREPVG